MYFRCARTIQEEQWGQVMGSKRVVKLKAWFSHLNSQFIRYRSYLNNMLDRNLGNHKLNKEVISTSPL